MSDITRRYAFVTGASTGIGRAFALELAKNNYFVFLAARRKDELQKVHEEIKKMGKYSLIVQTDLLKPADIKNAVDTVKSETDHIEVLANIAGVYHDSEKHFFGIPFQEYPDEAIVQNFNASLVGHVLLTKYLTPLMTKGGSVLNMSGTFDENETGVLPEFVTKKAIELFTKQLSLELASKGIRSNCGHLISFLQKAFKNFSLI